MTDTEKVNLIGNMLGGFFESMNESADYAKATIEAITVVVDFEQTDAEK